MKNKQDSELKLRLPRRHYLRLMWQKRWWRRLVMTLIVIVVTFFTAPLWNPVIFPPVKDPNFGVSFSVKRSRQLGINYQDNFIALLDDMKLRHFRLMSYWDESEKARGQFDFTDLDWQMTEAAKRGAKISLAIGLRQPRWPECHEPTWAKQLSGHTWKQALYAYMEAVVKRYEHHPVLSSWQLENEAVNDWFGECGTADVERINEEFALVKKWSTKPIYMSLSDQHGYPVNPPIPDKFGYSVYRTVWSERSWPYVGYLTYPTPIWYHRLRGSIIKLTTGRDIFIHELQLEPWGPRDTKDLPISEQDKSMDVKQIKASVLFAREIGLRDIDTWGAEWWYWRKVHGDTTIWDTVKNELVRP